MASSSSHKPAPPSLAVYQQIASAIERQIDAGLFHAGQRIYSIRGICENFGVGDVTAKRALRLLKQRGIVQSVVGSGAFVRQSRSAAGDAARPPRVRGVGLIMLGVNPRAIFQHEVDLVQQELQRLGHPLIYTSATNLAEIRDTLDHLIAAGVGCLLAFPRHGQWDERDKALDILRGAHLPLLLLESLSAQDACVAADIVNATGLLVDHLIQLGHRRICLMSAYQPKIDGFQRALAAGDRGAKGQIIRGSAGHHLEMVRLVEQFLELRPRPTAVIACNDRMADVVQQTCLQAGLRIPMDLSVATYDDHPALSAHLPVPLTEVRHPGLEIAQEVARWAHDRLEGRAAAGRFHRLITGSLIVRDSTAPPPPAP
jgi:DNA-binding LacI/PurR family transcriptional regulator